MPRCHLVNPGPTKESSESSWRRWRGGVAHLALEAPHALAVACPPELSLPAALQQYVRCPCEWCASRRATRASSDVLLGIARRRRRLPVDERAKCGSSSSPASRHRCKGTAELRPERVPPAPRVLDPQDALVHHHARDLPLRVEAVLDRHEPLVHCRDEPTEEVRERQRAHLLQQRVAAHEAARRLGRVRRRGDGDDRVAEGAAAEDSDDV